MCILYFLAEFCSSLTLQNLIILQFMKLVLSAIMFVIYEGGVFKHVSIKFAIPAGLYVVNNNIFLIALRYAPPGLWVLLIQSRIVLTAVVYRVILGRNISTNKWLSVIVLTVGVVMSQVKGDMSGMVVSPAAIGLALFSSVISVTTSIYVELLLKEHPSPFYEQQTQMYIHGVIASFAMWAMTTKSDWTVMMPNAWKDLAELDIERRTYVFLIIFNTGGGGLIVASIIKKLDNLAKIFAASVSIVLVGITGEYFFPGEVTIGMPFVLGTMLIVGAIVGYSRSA